MAHTWPDPFLAIRNPARKRPQITLELINIIFGKTCFSCFLCCVLLGFLPNHSMAGVTIHSACDDAVLWVNGQAVPYGAEKAHTLVQAPGSLDVDCKHHFLFAGETGTWSSSHSGPWLCIQATCKSWQYPQVSRVPRRAECYSFKFPNKRVADLRNRRTVTICRCHLVSQACLPAWFPCMTAFGAAATLCSLPRPPKHFYHVEKTWLPLSLMFLR